MIKLMARAVVIMMIYMIGITSAMLILMVTIVINMRTVFGVLANNILIIIVSVNKLLMIVRMLVIISITIAVVMVIIQKDKGPRAEGWMTTWAVMVMMPTTWTVS